MLGVSLVFGSADHPQSQGYIEGRRESVNSTLAALTEQNPGGWARWVKLVQWSLRTVPRADRGGYSVYEFVTGMKP